MDRKVLLLSLAAIFVVERCYAVTSCLETIGSLPAVVCADNLNGFFTCTINVNVFPPILERFTACPSGTRCICQKNRKCPVGVSNPCAPITAPESLPPSFTLRYHGGTEVSGLGIITTKLQAQGLWYQDGDKERLIKNDWIGDIWYFELYVPDGQGYWLRYKGNYASTNPLNPIRAYCLPVQTVANLPTLQYQLQSFVQTFTSATNRVYALFNGPLSFGQPSSARVWITVSDPRGFNRPDRYEETFDGGNDLPLKSKITFQVGLFENAVVPYSDDWFRIPPPCI